MPNATTSPLPPAPILHQQIWERYEQERPAQGLDYSHWVERVAGELGTSEYKVRQIISRQTHAFNAALARNIQTKAQQVADLLGADLVAALDTLRDGLTAGSKKPLLDKSGRPIINEKTGEQEWWETPNWDARLSAARSLIEVHGAKAPQQVNVDVEQNINLRLHTLSEAEIMEKCVGLVADIERFKGIASGNGSAAERVIDTSSEPERLLLADRGNEDSGRSGRT